MGSFEVVESRWGFLMAGAVPVLVLLTCCVRCLPLIRGVYAASLLLLCTSVEALRPAAACMHADATAVLPVHWLASLPGGVRQRQGLLPIAVKILIPSTH